MDLSSETDEVPASLHGCREEAPASASSERDEIPKEIKRSGILVQGNEFDQLPHGPVLANEWMVSQSSLEMLLSSLHQSDQGLRLTNHPARVLVGQHAR